MGGKLAARMRPAVGDPHAQALFILRKIGRALADVGASFGDVVRARYYVTDIG